MRSRRGADAGRLALAASAAAVLFLLGASFGDAAETAAWPRATWYTVVAQPGDTFATLSARYHVPTAIVVKLNPLEARRNLESGEVLRIPAEAARTRTAVLAEALGNAPNYASPAKSAGPTERARRRDVVAASDPSAPDRPSAGDRLGSRREPDAGAPVRFSWPVRGIVIAAFGPAGDGERNDGINIAAKRGAPIRAAAPGTVVYAGDELKHYGNLIVIAHAGGYISAYAHAQTIAVLRGDRVATGEVIGSAGNTGGVGRPQLHFEIREGVRPLDPVPLLTASR